MERKGGCCKQKQELGARLKHREQQLAIALRALGTYTLTPNSIIAEDALLRIRALDPQAFDRLRGG